MADALTIMEISMANDQMQMKAISHNLANVSTVGFRRNVVSTRAFADYLQIQAGEFRGVSLPQMEIRSDFSAGSLKYTGNPLDLAIESNGYFEVMTEQGPVYTRRGNFRLDESGRIVTAAGQIVAAHEGDIRLTSANPSINKQGEVWEGDRKVGQLRVVRFENEDTLVATGAGQYQPGAATVMAAAEDVKLRQGYQEAANVDMTREMVKMVETVRHYESSQKVMQGYDSMLDVSIRVLGEF